MVVAFRIQPYHYIGDKECASIDGSCAALLTMTITNISLFTGYVLVIINNEFGGKYSKLPDGTDDMSK